MQLRHERFDPPASQQVQPAMLCPEALSGTGHCRGTTVPGEAVSCQTFDCPQLMGGTAIGGTINSLEKA